MEIRWLIFYVIEPFKSGSILNYQIHVSGVLTFTLFDAGLVAVPSPGSIFALLAMTPKGNHLGVLAGVIVAAAVSFLVASIFLKAAKNNEEEEDLSKATEKMQQLKGKMSEVAAALQTKQPFQPK